VTCFVIMGAAVRPDGSPSGAMRRRVEAAFALGRAASDAFYLATGGQGRFGPPEATVMTSLLEVAGVTNDHILVDTEAHDTLSSVLNCARILKTRSFDSVIVCTDRYHVPRCRLLFWMLGIRTTKQVMPSGVGTAGLPRWIYYYLRECLALPWDAMLLSGRRLIQRA
jgi:vancomycin permeability regulator SanA